MAFSKFNPGCCCDGACEGVATLGLDNWSDYGRDQKTLWSMSGWLYREDTVSSVTKLGAVTVSEEEPSVFVGGGEKVTVQDGTTDTEVVTDSESDSSGYFVGASVTFLGGELAGIVREITGYDGVTKTLQFGEPWPVVPKTGTELYIPQDLTSSGTSDYLWMSNIEGESVESYAGGGGSSVKRNADGSLTTTTRSTRYQWKNIWVQARPLAKLTTPHTWDIFNDPDRTVVIYQPFPRWTPNDNPTVPMELPEVSGNSRHIKFPNFGYKDNDDAFWHRTNAGGLEVNTGPLKSNASEKTNSGSTWKGMNYQTTEPTNVAEHDGAIFNDNLFDSTGEDVWLSYDGQYQRYEPFYLRPDHDTDSRRSLWPYSDDTMFRFFAVDRFTDSTWYGYYGVGFHERAAKKGSSYAISADNSWMNARLRPTYTQPELYDVEIDTQSGGRILTSKDTITDGKVLSFSLKSHYETAGRTEHDPEGVGFLVDEEMAVDVEILNDDDTLEHSVRIDIVHGKNIPGSYSDPSKGYQLSKILKVYEYNVIGGGIPLQRFSGPYFVDSDLTPGYAYYLRISVRGEPVRYQLLGFSTAYIHHNTPLNERSSYDPLGISLLFRDGNLYIASRETPANWFTPGVITNYYYRSLRGFTLPINKGDFQDRTERQMMYGYLLPDAHPYIEYLGYGPDIGGDYGHYIPNNYRSFPAVTRTPHRGEMLPVPEDSGTGDMLWLATGGATDLKGKRWRIKGSWLGRTDLGYIKYCALDKSLENYPPFEMTQYSLADPDKYTALVSGEYGCYAGSSTWYGDGTSSVTAEVVSSDSSSFKVKPAESSSRFDNGSVYTQSEKVLSELQYMGYSQSSRQTWHRTYRLKNEDGDTGNAYTRDQILRLDYRAVAKVGLPEDAWTGEWNLKMTHVRVGPGDAPDTTKYQITYQATVDFITSNEEFDESGPGSNFPPTEVTGQTDQYGDPVVLNNFKYARSSVEAFKDYKLSRPVDNFEFPEADIEGGNSSGPEYPEPAFPTPAEGCVAVPIYSLLGVTRHRTYTLVHDDIESSEVYYSPAGGICRRIPGTVKTFVTASDVLYVDVPNEGGEVTIDFERSSPSEYVYLYEVDDDITQTGYETQTPNFVYTDVSSWSDVEGGSCPETLPEYITDVNRNYEYSGDLKPYSEILGYYGLPGYSGAEKNVTKHQKIINNDMFGLKITFPPQE